MPTVARDWRSLICRLGKRARGMKGHPGRRVESGGHPSPQNFPRDDRFHHSSEPVTHLMVPPPVVPPSATDVHAPVVWFQAAAVPLLFTTTKLPADPAMSPKALIPRDTVDHVPAGSFQAAAEPPLFATAKLPPDAAIPP